MKTSYTNNPDMLDAMVKLQDLTLEMTDLLCKIKSQGEFCEDSRRQWKILRHKISHQTALVRCGEFTKQAIKKAMEK